LEEDVMLADAPASIALKCATQLLTVLAFTVLIANTGIAADLRLQLTEAPQHEKSLSATPREQLLKGFLDCLKKREQR
jgi:hypothetical protein